MSSIAFIIVIVLFIYIQNILYEKYSFKKLYIRRAFEQEGVFPGETVSYNVTVVNKKLLPLTWLCIDENLPYSMEFENEQTIEPCSETSFVHKLIFTILPYQRIKRGYKIKCLKRGYYNIKDITIYSTNLLGSKIYEDKRFLLNCVAVYPQIREIGDEFIPANTLMGDFSIDRWIIDDPMMITGIRNYQNRDSFKSINWKQTAKNQKILVNKYDYTADKKIMLILNLDKAEYMLEESDIPYIEEAISIGASLSLKLIQSGIPTGIATNSVCIGESSNSVLEPDTGKQHISNMLKVFSQITYMKKYKSRELFKELVKNFSWGTEIIILSVTPTEELMNDLELMGNIKTTVIAFRKNNLEYIPENISLYYHSKDGESYETA